MIEPFKSTLFMRLGDYQQSFLTEYDEVTLEHTKYRNMDQNLIKKKKTKKLEAYEDYFQTYSPEIDSFRIYQNLAKVTKLEAYPRIFSSPVRMYRKSCCTTPGIGIGGYISKMLKFYIKVFYVMGKGANRQVIMYEDKS